MLEADPPQCFSMILDLSGTVYLLISRLYAAVKSILIKNNNKVVLKVLFFFVFLPKISFSLKENIFFSNSFTKASKVQVKA